MSVCVLSDKHGQSAFYCSTTDWAFGPVMESEEVADAFLKYLEPTDPRVLTDADLRKRYNDFMEKNVCECGNVRETKPCEYCEDGHPIESDGLHHWDEDGEICIEECQADPEPTDGTRYQCPWCFEKAAKKRQKQAVTA